ncbi:MAG: hypothetical protein ACR2IH_14070 [Pyrinomonadaceae bacterium]
MVRLKVVLLATGKVGDVQVGSGLTVSLFEDGTTNLNSVESKLPAEFESSVREAVKNIKFEPAVNDKGEKISVDRKIEYVFPPQN